MSRPLRVAYIGNFQHRHCTEVHIAASLEDLGHTVIRLQENEVPVRAIAGRAAGADLLLYTRTWGLTPRNEAIATWRLLESRGTVTASYHLDLYLGLARADTLNGDPFWETGHVFTPDGDPASEQAFTERGIQHHWCPPAVWRDECVIGRRRPEFSHQVVFVGSYPYPHPEWPYRDELVGWAQRTYRGDFARYGGGSQVIRNEPLNDLYRSCGVVIGDTLCPGFTKPRYWSDRLTETIGRGGALVFPRVEGIEELGFVDGEHLRFYTFGDFDELERAVSDLLASDVNRHAMKRLGQEFVRENHTYHNRLTAALETMGLS